jgi:hypothetical protein
VTVGTSISSDFNNFSNPTNEGLLIFSNGPVSVSNVTSNNASKGVSINNQGLGLSGTGSVTLVNINVSGGFDDGVEIFTNGNTSLTGIGSNNNGNSGSGTGIAIQVGLSTGGTSGTVSLTNITTTYNHDDEINIQALRQVTFKNIYLYDYSYLGKGVVINTTGGVSILDPGGSIWNEITSNHDTNLQINAGGDVVLQKVSASSSGLGYGVLVNTPGKVTV